MALSRRRCLRIVSGLAFGSSVAGCVAPGNGPAAEVAPPENPDWLVPYGFPGSLCESGAIPDVGIRAIVAPAFDDGWSDREIPLPYWFPQAGSDPLPDDGVVVGISAGDRARAYPLTVLSRHEVVNDEFVTADGERRPLLVTYCPITRSVLVADRLVDGDPTTFAVSGHLWQPPAEHTAGSVAAGRVFGASRTNARAAVRNGGNLVMVDDATGSFWSQLLVRGVCGTQSGVALASLPVTVARWADWRRAQPRTDVLLPPPHSVER